jgi:hypothetical protein
MFSRKFKGGKLASSCLDTATEMDGLPGLEDEALPDRNHR